MGVQRQYCGALGKIGNCQVAVSSALIADGRTRPLAFDLYIPVSSIARTPVRTGTTVRRCVHTRAASHGECVMKCWSA